MANSRTTTRTNLFVCSPRQFQWFKRIDSLPNNSDAENIRHKVRPIGNKLFLPIEETNSIEQTQTGCVLSQSITIFDNLVNQTFTVVNGLQLSQCVEPAGARAYDLLGVDKRSGDTTSGQHNLYACMVDADVRHSFATLAVNYRTAPIINQLPRELRRLLHARTMTKGRKPPPLRTNVDNNFMVASEQNVADKMNFMRASNQLTGKLFYLHTCNT